MKNPTLNWSLIFKSFLIDYYLTKPEVRAEALTGNVVHMKCIREKVLEDIKFPIFSPINALMFIIIKATLNNDLVVKYFIDHLNLDMKDEHWCNLFGKIMSIRLLRHEFKPDGEVLIHKMYSNVEISLLIAENYTLIQEFVKSLFTEDPKGLEFSEMRSRFQISISADYSNPGTAIARHKQFEYNTIEEFYMSEEAQELDFVDYLKRKIHLLITERNIAVTPSPLTYFMTGFAIILLPSGTSYSEIKEHLNQNYDV